jgi:tetraacyldisaccharide 4'-kinase
VVAWRNRRYDVRGAVHVDRLWVVSVGNLSVGGTGKTPLAAWAVRLLTGAGMPTTIVARGYGEDELLLHRRWNGDVPVVARADRVAAARSARENGAAAVVLDDGFQHRRCARDVDIVLLAAEDGLPGRMLPRGPFREPLSALVRADGVVVTRRTATAEEARALAEAVAREHPHLVVGIVALLPGAWQDLGRRARRPPTPPTMAVAAVARPDAFAVQVRRATGGDVELMAFPDHHDFDEVDARTVRARAGSRTIVVTEKDAVKLERFAALLSPVRVMVLALVWEEGEGSVTDLITSGREA